MDGRIKFRSDVQVFKYDDVQDRHTVVLKDPLSEKFYYLSVYEYRFLKCLDGERTLEEAVEWLRSSGYYYSLEEAGLITSKAAQLGLVLGSKYGTAEYQGQLKEHFLKAKKAARFTSVYFLFIPLINPDKFLEKTLWIAKLFANRFTAILMALALPVSLYLIFTGFSKMQAEYLFFFSWENLLYLWATLALTKLIHEFAHAYTAKSYGLHVPQMGVAFLIFFPCLFCNTTDAWQLADRRQRMAISAAGILAEGALAIISTFIWYSTKPGVLNSLAFYLIAISFISTVLFNANPLMRFDGYFILMDFLRLPNFYTRAMAYVRYLVMNRVLGMPLVPNPATTPREVVLFAVYGVCAFLYRCFLYTAIVMGVYYRFDKLLGIALAVTAFALFIVRPLWKAGKSLWSKRNELSPRTSGVRAIAILAIVIMAVLLVPFSGKSVYPCYVASAKSQKLTVPLQTFVEKVMVREGTPVQEGGLLFTLDPHVLELNVQQKEIKRDMLLTEIKLLLLDEKRMAAAAQKEIEVAQLQDEIRKIRKDLALAKDGVRAPFDGIVTNLDYRVQDGYQPGEGTVVGEFESPKHRVVRALIPEKDLSKLHTGQQAEIWFRSGTGVIVKGVVDEIRPYSEQDIKDLPFSSRLGGDLATETKGPENADVPLDAHYQCSVPLQESDERIQLGMTGTLFVHAPRQSLLASFLDKIGKELNREAFF